MPDPARRSRWSPRAGALGLIVGLILSGCTAVPLVEDSTITVAVSQAFFSLNDRTSYGDSPANTGVLQATSSRFSAYDAESELVADPSFGSYQLLSSDPLTVRYTIDSRATWSDGVPVDAADLLLAWAANSGVLNTAGFDDGAYVDQETGRYTAPFPSDVVYFDGATSEGLQYVTRTPELGEDGRSLTLTWDRYFVDWPLVLEVGLPAHVVAAHALALSPGAAGGERSEDDRIRDAEAAKQALVAAIQDRDTAKLSAIGNVWNSDFNLDGMPDDPSVLVSTGPYTITGFVAGDQLVLGANPRYRGDHPPVFETIVLRFVTDPLAQVQDFAEGRAGVIVPQPNPDAVEAIRRVSGSTGDAVTVLDGVGGSYEHLDLVFADSKNGVFDDRRVREAFLKVVPRQEILDAMVASVRGEAALRSSQVFLPGAPGYEDSVAGNGSASLREVDVDGAKALLAEAGAVNPTVCILFDPANPKRQEEFRLIGQSASAAGFTVTDCSSPDWINLLGTPGTHDASIFSWRVENLSFAGLQAIYVTDGLSNLNGYSSPRVDELLATLSITVDPAEQRELRKRIDAALFDDAYGLPLYQSPVIVVHDDAVRGIALAPLAPGILWNVWEWAPAAEETKTPAPGG